MRDETTDTTQDPAPAQPQTTDPPAAQDQGDGSGEVKEETLADA